MIKKRVSFTFNNNNNILVLILLLSILFLLSIQFSYADNNNNRSLLHNNAELLGWISISCGLIANVPFILYVRVKRLSVKRLGGGDSLTRNLALEHKPIINFHIALNLIGFFTGIFHGILLVRGIDFISISLAIVITTLTVSGILLRFAKLRIINQFNRIIHTHIILSTLLVILIILH
ncbi:MAG TPA: hypothetical protein VLA48_07600, partial [Nitrososphaeraceae archaeon]|nr:hypothetical protein [Nitrososphaeraceae archaeon]